MFASGELVRVVKPDTSASASAELLYGATILDLDLALDARGQVAAVKGVMYR